MIGKLLLETELFRAILAIIWSRSSVLLVDITDVSNNVVAVQELFVTNATFVISLPSVTFHVTP